MVVLVQLTLKLLVNVNDKYCVYCHIVYTEYQAFCFSYIPRDKFCPKNKMPNILFIGNLYLTFKKNNKMNSIKRYFDGIIFLRMDLVL